MNRIYISYLLSFLNPLNAELNPIYHLLALLGAHPILHISGVRVKHKEGSWHHVSTSKLIYEDSCLLGCEWLLTF